MKIAKLATTATIAFAVSTAASGAAIYQSLDMSQTERLQLLQIADNHAEQPAGTEAGAFKNKDPDSTPLRTDDPADVVVKPEPGAEPKPMVNKDPDTIIRNADTTSPATESPDPGAQPEPFEGKDQAGMDKTPRTD